MVPTLVGLDRNRAQALHAAGQPLPPPLRGDGLLDTATDVTALAPRLISALGLVRTGWAQTLAVTGLLTVEVFEVSLSIYDPGAGAGGAVLFRPIWTVTRLPEDLPGIDLLIGMDLISEIELLIRGPHREVHLDF